MNTSTDSIPIIDVDILGRDALGETFDVRAYPDKIAAGLLVEKRVKLRYPDGHIVPAIQVMVTSKGLSLFARKFGGHEGGVQ